MSHICEEYAKSLGVRLGRPSISDHFFPIPFDKYITIQSTSKFESRNYSFWDLSISLIKERLPSYKIVQVGTREDPLCRNADLSLLGATSFKQLFYVIKNSSLHLGIDSLGVHVASALDIPCVGIYSNMLPSQSGPIWHKDSLFKCIESDKKGNKPSYAPVENPKTINTIKPEDIAGSALDLLGADSDLLNYRTLYLGPHYANEILEVIPNFNPSPNYTPGLVVNLRCDYGAVEKSLPAWLSFKSNIMTSSPLDLGLLSAFRGNIAGLTIFLESGSINKDYLKSLSRLNIKFNLICRDKSKLQDLRFEFFDWVVEEHVKLSKKDIDFDSEICDNTFYHSNKVLVSEGKNYLSKASWKAGIEKTKEPQRLIDSDEFWEEIEHLNVYNYAKKESTGLGNVK